MEEGEKRLRSLKMGIATRERLLMDLKRRTHKARSIFAKYDPRIMNHQTLYESLLEFIAWMHRYMINSMASIKELEASEGWFEGTKLYYDTSFTIDGGEPIRGFFIPYGPSKVNAFGDIRLDHEGVVASTQTDELVIPPTSPKPAEESGPVQSGTGASGEKIREAAVGISAARGLLASIPTLDVARLPVRGDTGPKSAVKVTSMSTPTGPSPRTPPSSSSWNLDMGRSIPRPKTALPSAKLEPDPFEISISRSAERIRSSIWDIQEYVASLSQMCIVPSRVQSDASLSSLSGTRSRYFDPHAAWEVKEEPGGDEKARRSSSAMDVIVTYRNPKGMSPQKSVCQVDPARWPQFQEGISKEGVMKCKPLAKSENLLEDAVNKVRKELMTRRSLPSWSHQSNLESAEQEVFQTLERWRDEREGTLEKESVVSIPVPVLNEEVKSVPTLKSETMKSPGRKQKPKLTGITTVGPDNVHVEEDHGSVEMVEKEQLAVDENEKHLQEKEEKVKLKQEKKNVWPTRPPQAEVKVKKPKKPTAVAEEGPPKGPKSPPQPPPPLMTAKTECRKESVVRQEAFLNGEMVKVLKTIQEKKKLEQKQNQKLEQERKQRKKPNNDGGYRGNVAEPQPGGSWKPVGLMDKGHRTPLDPQPAEVKPGGTWKPIGRKLQEELMEVLSMEAFLEERNGTWKRTKIPTEEVPKEKEPKAPLKKPEGRWKLTGRIAEDKSETKRKPEVIDIKPDGGTWRPRRSPEETPKPHQDLFPRREPFPKPFGPKPELGYAELGARRQPEEETSPRERLIPDKDPFPVPYTSKPKTYSGMHKKMVEIRGVPTAIPKTIHAIEIVPNKALKDVKLNVVSHIIQPKPKPHASQLLRPTRSTSVPSNLNLTNDAAAARALSPRSNYDEDGPKNGRGCPDARGRRARPFHVPAATGRYRGVSVGGKQRYTTEYQASYKPYD